MVVIKALGSLAAAALSLALATPGLAQSQTPTLFVAEFEQVPADEERVADSGDAILNVTLRPELVVELTSVPDERTQRDIGVARDALLTEGTRLYGSSNRRSLFCHIINDRLVASGGTCFRDFDNDGAFEQGVKLEAPSLDTDVVLLNQDGDWYGGTFVDRERLRPAITYRPVEAADVPTWPARIWWHANVNRVDPEDYPVVLTFGISEISSGGDVIGTCALRELYAGEPVTIHVYGNVIEVLGFEENGDMRYRVRSNPDPLTIGMIYQFESRNAYVGMALAHNARELPCNDPSAVLPAE
ncbi:hypothetical protein [Aurantiacibacter sp. MUD61]|uniref:hypothetical protein n=1 Tax=Aurantiacibacter sp. MUD61 TaxID=3009083 RepID=UPI0022F06448|nr:hypothetical protein [Aurantiacibacter sp. MUD61]